MGNEGINCGGFGGDTMHMARLWDTSRSRMTGGGGYDLASLSNELCGERFVKTSMKDLFGVSRSLKNGEVGKIKVDRIQICQPSFVSPLPTVYHQLQYFFSVLLILPSPYILSSLSS